MEYCVTCICVPDPDSIEFEPQIGTVRAGLFLETKQATTEERKTNFTESP